MDHWIRKIIPVDRGIKRELDESRDVRLLT